MTIQLNPLDPADPFHTSKSLLRGLLSDISRLRPGTLGLGRDLVTLEARLEHEGYGLLSTALSSLATAVIRGESLGWFTCPIGFKKAKGTQIPAFLQGIVGDVFDPSTGQLKKGVDAVDEIKLILQICYFLEEVLSTTEESREANLDCIQRLQSCGFERPSELFGLAFVSCPTYFLALSQFTRCVPRH